MGKHTASTPPRKVAPHFVLGLTAASILSPLGILLMPAEVEAEAILPEQVPFLSSSPKFDAAAVLAAAREQAVIPPTPSAVTSRPPTRIDRTTRPPTSRPVPTTTTRPSRPTIAERQVQRATRSTTPASRTTPRRAATPVRQIPVPTTTKVPTSSRVIPKPTPVIITTTPKPTPKPQPKPTTTTPTPTTISTTRVTTTTTTKKPSVVGTERIVPIAQKYVGRGMPYVMGGNSSTTGIDCSHFIWMVLKEAGYNVPYRDSATLASWTTRVTTPLPGDLVLYRGHVGIYAGDGMMVHHGKPGGAFFIKVYKDNFIGYGRMNV